MAITQLTGLPDPTMSQAQFDQAVANMMTSWPIFIQEANTQAAGMTSIAAGTAFAVPYTFSSTTTDADPGPGFLRLSSATQNASGVLRLDVTSAMQQDVTALIDSFTASNSGVKGQLRLVKLGDAAKWLAFNLTAIASPAGYRNLAVAPVASSETNPFANGDSLALLFTRTGDVGANGSVVWRTNTLATASAPALNMDTYDMLALTALAEACTLGAPTGTLTEGRRLMLRVRDNGTARALAYNTIFRASPDLALPTSTVIGKTLYMGFIYNATDTRFDLISVLGNF